MLFLQVFCKFEMIAKEIIIIIVVVIIVTTFGESSCVYEPERGRGIGRRET